MPLFDDIIEDEGLRTKVIEAHEEVVKILKDDLNAEFTGKLDQEVTGLKTKNEEIIGEKKKLQDKLSLFEGIEDPKAALEALELMEKNDDIKLIKDGKMDELVEMKTSQMRSDHEAALGELNSKLTEATDRGNKFETLYNTKTVDDDLRQVALDAGVLPQAIPDVLLRGRSIFSVSDDGSVEARGKDGKLMKTEDEKILTSKNWIEGLKTSSPHYWPVSEGAGARGGGAGAGSDLDAQIHAAAAKGDHVLYRSLKAKKAKLVG